MCNLGPSSINFLFCSMRGLDLKVFKMCPVSPGSLQRCLLGLGKGGEPWAYRRTAQPLFCFLFGASAFLFYILDFCQEFKNKIFLKKEFPCLQKSLKIFGLVVQLQCKVLLAFLHLPNAACLLTIATSSPTPDLSQVNKYYRKGCGYSWWQNICFGGSRPWVPSLVPDTHAQNYREILTHYNTLFWMIFFFLFVLVKTCSSFWYYVAYKQHSHIYY